MQNDKGEINTGNISHNCVHVVAIVMAYVQSDNVSRYHDSVIARAR